MKVRDGFTETLCKIHVTPSIKTGSTDWLRKGSLRWRSGEDLVSSLLHSTNRTTVVHICSHPAGQKTGPAFLPLKKQPWVLTLHISLELVCEPKDLCDSESMNPRLFRILAPGLFHATHRLPLTGKACIRPQQNTSKMESLEFRTFTFQDLIFLKKASEKTFSLSNQTARSMH